MIVPGDASGKVELDNSPYHGGGYPTGGGNTNATIAPAEVNGQGVVEADVGQGNRYINGAPVELDGWRGGAR